MLPIDDAFMRRFVLLQSLLSFAFNAAILAFTINIAAGLFGGGPLPLIVQPSGCPIPGQEWPTGSHRAGVEVSRR